MSTNGELYPEVKVENYLRYKGFHPSSYKADGLQRWDDGKNNGSTVPETVFGKPNAICSPLKDKTGVPSSNT